MSFRGRCLGFRGAVRIRRGICTSASLSWSKWFSAAFEGSQVLDLYERLLLGINWGSGKAIG